MDPMPSGRRSRHTPHPTLPLKGGGTFMPRGIPSPLEGEGRVGGARGAAVEKGSLLQRRGEK
jgi:hypothetical protein